MVKSDKKLRLHLKTTIHSHREFFDQLVELIPARFYLSADDSESKPWYQGLSKAAKASLKQQSRENLKLARRNRFDPEGEPLDHRSAATAPEDGNPVKFEDDEDNERSVTYEALREKLRRKIELLRGNRGEGKPEERRMKYEAKKRQRDSEVDEKQGQLDEDDDGEEEIIEYGKVRLGDEDYKGGKQSKKRKVSKAKELEIAKQTQEAKRENPTVAERESWKAAANRVMGVKVHDDARLIKESMKKEKKKKEKNAEKWKERVESREKMKADKQKKRRENIVGRINEKKQRKIAKREKKLMRPGFEGRKEGFITKD